MRQGLLSKSCVTGKSVNQTAIAAVATLSDPFGRRGSYAHHPVWPKRRGFLQLMQCTAYATHAWAFIGISLLLSMSTFAQTTAPANNFPAFIVPGHEREMELLRSLFWL